jgi:hypothetical protein
MYTFLFFPKRTSKVKRIRNIKKFTSTILSFNANAITLAYLKGLGLQGGNIALGRLYLNCMTL